MVFEKMDKIDRRLLSALQSDSRRSIAEFADLAGLSPSACHRRIRLLEDAGIIEGYGAKMNGKKLGYAIEFFVEVTLNTQNKDALQQFEAAVARLPEVVECRLMTGQFDYILHVAAKDTADYERIHRDHIARLPDVDRIQSSLVLRTVKGWAGYPA